MAKRRAHDEHTPQTRDGRFSSRAKNQLAFFLTCIMISSLFAPSVLVAETALEPSAKQYETSNNSLNDSAIQTLMSNLNATNPVEITGVIDDLNRAHLVWVENTSLPSLQYALISTNGIDTVLISSTLVGENDTLSVTNPALVIDSNQRAHIVWEITGIAILYALIDPSMDDLDGDTGDITNMTLTSHTVADGIGTRYQPDIAIDSFDGAHVVWVDTYDPQGLYFGSPLIYYSMLTYDSSGNFDIQISNTIITTALGYKGNPAVSMGSNNTVIVVWEDTRGSLVEYVGLLDTSGSMTSEWKDMCAVFYGGNLTSGEYFQGVKPLLESASITVLETLYALSGQMSHASTHKNCEDGYVLGGNSSEGPRSSHLGQNSTDTSGGIRDLEAVVYNGSSYSLPTDFGFFSEMWGPGSTWACESWRDGSGMTPGDPATALDHQWNPNATKLVIPVSDEGPYGGTPITLDDTQSIIEAHDACVGAGIIPVAIAGVTGNTVDNMNVRSNMLDLTQCPGSSVGLHPRICADTSVSTTDAGGDMFLYPTNEMANFEGDFESGTLTNGWSSTGSSGSTWDAEAANNGIVWSEVNLCDIGAAAGAGSFHTVTCNYTQPAGRVVDLTVSVDSWPSEFSMDVVLPNGNVASFNRTSVSSNYHGVLVTFAGPGNYTIYLNDTYGDGGTSVSADYSYVSANNPPATPISGAYSARSGDISDSETTTMEFTGSMSNGTVAFSYNVSSEPNYDFLTFSIDGVQLAQWSGTQSGNFSTPVSLGQHTLTWSYVKDGSISSGSDAAWVDDVTIPLANYTQEMQALVQSIIALTSGTGATETFLTVLNPYSLLNTPRSTWVPGDSATSIDPDTGQYVEDVGPAVDYVWQDGIGWGTIGHFVLVNDTRLTNGHGWSSSPDVNVDDDGNIHVVWVDGRSTIPSKAGPSQLHYMQLDLSHAGILDGEPEGLDISEVAVVSDSAVQDSDMTWGSNPRVDFDNDGSIHITWFESMEESNEQGETVELRWTRIAGPSLIDGEMPLGRTLEQAYEVIDTRVIATSSDNLMGVSGHGLDTSSQPIVNFDWPNRVIVWSTPDCSGEESGEQQWGVCLWSENLYEMAMEQISGTANQITLEPGQSSNVAMQLRGITIPGGSDTVIAGVTEVPLHWHVETGFSGRYQETTTLFEGGVKDIDLYIHAPALQNVNANQSFELTVWVASTTNQEATTAKTFLIHLVNEGDWDDDDGDGIPDFEDACQFGDTGWIPDETTDYDGDGCRDATEDLDDDNDGHLDVDDNCPNGYMGEHLDADNDGCDDLSEDKDNDGDGIENHLDLCPNGAQYWAGTAEDNDGDGCRDADEDYNDDNDPYLDSADDCPSGTTWWIDGDFDGDGCHDTTEDTDWDNDGVSNTHDNCPRGALGWFSTMLNDYDKDGCHDTAEDDDWDNDGVTNTHDNCPRGALGWFSTTLNDWDQDGCRDSTEDPDDDNDGFLDWEDSCERSPIIEGYDWRTNFDNDNDGCEDTTEDTDLDNDGVESQYDNCENEPDSNWVSAPDVDFDGDGCADSVDTDDDDDGISDDVDGCPLTESVSSDFDRDGCDDSTEDLDDDGDGVEDSTDKCPLGLINWDSSSGSDIDADGCMDSLEDDHVDGQLLYILRNNALMTMISITMLVLLLAGLVASNGKRRSGIRIKDHTWEVERMMQTPSISLEKPIEETQRQVRDLTDFGYSPEVAEAIVMHEERARRYQ
ncbi:MAG: hypothetical protein CMA26_02845 [Euryarchaeota archaeon]|nr:hypothetical protein [Euryarchaeota archaeon]